MWCSRKGVVGVYLRVCFIYYYDGYIFSIRSNMGLCISAKVSFICNLCLLKLYMWNCSSVLSDWPFFSVCSISNAWLIVCPVSSICWAYFEFRLFVFMAWICSLYWTYKNICPVCPLYLSGHSLHFNWHTPSLLYVSIFPSLGFRLILLCISSFECYL
jgi:hypothetical protein